VTGPGVRGSAAPGGGAGSGAPWIARADRRVGILGGTFDPIHYGHLLIAEQVLEALQLDRVVFVPAAMPPHKIDDAISPAADRAAMVRLAIAGNPLFSACEIELERPGPSYTVDTIAQLADEAARHGVDREFHFILSVEALAWLKTWHEPARLLELARLAVVARPGAPMPAGRRLGALLPGGVASLNRVESVETLLVAHSASDVRARVASGRSIRYLVPPAVEAYIRDHRLYRSDNSMRTA
jgi:nicotinate-nucleotide adenylyltransferase